MLITRSTIYKILGILVLMCSVEFLLFSRKVAVNRENYITGLEYAVEKSWIVFVFFTAVISAIYVLSTFSGGKKANTRYTLDRLQISESWIFCWQIIYCTLCFALIILVQTAMAIGLCHYYVEFSGDSTITHQTVFLAFYRNQFLHSLLPFDEPHSIAANILTVLVLGLSTAHMTFAKKYKRSSFPSFAGAYTIVCFARRETGSFLNDMCIYVLFAVVVFYTIYFLLTKEDRYEC